MEKEVLDRTRALQTVIMAFDMFNGWDDHRLPKRVMIWNPPVRIRGGPPR